MDERLFLRQYRRFHQIVTAEYGVVNRLNELKFKDFWRRFRNIDINDIEVYSKYLIYLDRQQRKRKNDKSEDLQEEEFIYFLEDFEENLEAKHFLNEAGEDVSNTKRLGKDLSEIKEGGLLNAYYKSKKIVFALVIWSVFKIMLQLLHRDLKLSVSHNRGEKSITNVGNATKCDLEKETEDIFDESKRLMDFSSDENIKRIYVDKRNFFNEIKKAGKERDINKFFQLWDIFYSDRHSVAEHGMLFLFVILNIPFYSISQREEIVNYLRTTMFKYLLQQRYNVFKKKFPDVIDWKFCDYLPHSLEFPEDVKAVRSTEDDCPHNYSKEMLGPSDALKKQISKIKEDKYREVLEKLYNYLTGVDTDNIGKKTKYIECNKIDFIYLLGGELLEGECITDDPIIEWVEGTRTNMNGFFYALYGCEGSAYKELGKGAKKDCYCFMSNGARKRVNIKENHNKSIEYMKKWENLFKKIGDKVVRDSIGKK
ncbi:MAG: hypothetical protein J6C15_09780 [Bacteroidaceae bacterium]|nr:hypothetical protein [Bacteroidaceae bacterium]